MKKITLLFSLLFVAMMIHAQTFEESQKIYAADGNDQGFFGNSVSMSDSYILAGNGILNNYYAKGAAYVFYKNNGTWMQLTKLTPSNPSDSWSFGVSVSTDENHFVVGVPEAAGNSRGSIGNAYVYTLENGGFQEVSLLPDSIPGSHLYFGTSVSVKGDYIMVGAPRDMWVTDSYLYFYKNNNGSWELTQKITGPANSKFGSSTAMTEQYAVVGAPKHNAVYIYTIDNTNDTLGNEILLEYGTGNDEFGHSVSMTDDYLAVGAWKTDVNDTVVDAGTVYIFNKYNGFWVLQQTIVSDTVSEGALFGSSVSISGDYLTVGAQNDETDSIRSGSIYIYHNTGSTWELTKKMTASDSKADAKYGCSVSMLDGQIVVGARDAEGLTNVSGAAYIVGNSGVGINEKEKSGNLVGYPNPAHSIFTIKINKNENYKNYELLNLSGRIMNRGLISGTTTTVDLSGLPKGLYLLKVNNNKGLFKMLKLLKN